MNEGIETDKEQFEDVDFNNESAPQRNDFGGGLAEEALGAQPTEGGAMNEYNVEAPPMCEEPQIEVSPKETAAPIDDTYPPDRSLLLSFKSHRARSIYLSQSWIFAHFPKLPGIPKEQHSVTTEYCTRWKWGLSITDQTGARELLKYREAFDNYKVEDAIESKQLRVRIEQIKQDKILNDVVYEQYVKSFEKLPAKLDEKEIESSFQRAASIDLNGATTYVEMAKENSGRSCSLEQLPTLEARVHAIALWKPKGTCRLILVGKGYITIFLDNEEDRNKIWSATKHTRPSMVKFPRLGVEFWEFDTLMTIGRTLGTPIQVDQSSTTMEFGYFAKVLVDVNLAEPTPNKILVEVEGADF
ncbi:hypothetical protein GIB67_018432 [Kingdonia uniflora]|uniref:Uncharacterized protein n=1 Tax=Kingdonia uniflora TaxID=39325 RepID=A0A7J7LJ70_9MAGN|nr:hypothetical protein GIB67_018432 [Kingdonia uniflora]